MKSKILGYVVLADGIACHAAPDNPGDRPTLWSGNQVTLFETRKAARRVLQRTRQFAITKKYNWPWYDRAQVIAVRGL